MNSRIIPVIQMAHGKQMKMGTRYSAFNCLCCHSVNLCVEFFFGWNTAHLEKDERIERTKELNKRKN